MKKLGLIILLGLSQALPSVAQQQQVTLDLQQTIRYFVYCLFFYRHCILFKCYAKKRKQGKCFFCQTFPKRFVVLCQ